MHLQELLKALELGFESLKVFEFLLLLTKLSLELLALFHKSSLIFLNAGALLFPGLRLLAQPDEFFVFFLPVHTGLIVASQDVRCPGFSRIPRKTSPLIHLLERGSLKVYLARLLGATG